MAGCFDRSINVAKLEDEYDVTIDTAAYTLNYYDMRAALNSATVESLRYAENLVDGVRLPQLREQDAVQSPGEHVRADHVRQELGGVQVVRGINGRSQGDRVSLGVGGR